MAKATKKEAGKSLKAKNLVRTIDQMSIARQISEKLGYKILRHYSLLDTSKRLTRQYSQSSTTPKSLQTSTRKSLRSTP